MVFLKIETVTSFQKLLHDFIKIAPSLPVKIQVSTADSLVQLIIDDVRRCRHVGNQCVADEGNTHTGTSDVV